MVTHDSLFCFVNSLKILAFFNDKQGRDCEATNPKIKITLPSFGNRYSEVIRRRRIINNHGYGMPQHAANYLTQYGWPASNDNRPTEGAKVPNNIHEPWTWIDVINYFYKGEDPLVEIKDFRQL